MARSEAEAIIKSIEDKLVICFAFNKVCEASAESAAQKIEEYFAKILNALAKRKASLLGAVYHHLNHQKKIMKNVQEILEKSLAAHKLTIQAASIMNTINPEMAEQMHKGIISSPNPNVVDANIIYELPPAVFEYIHTLGKVCINDRYFVVDTVTTLAGFIQGKRDGDGTVAQFNFPHAICHAPHDDCLYVCDYNNASIRKVTIQGYVDTFVSNTGLITNPAAIAVYHKENTFVVACYTSHTIYKITTAGKVSVLAGSRQIGKTDGVGASARFANPIGLAIDQQTGNIYVSEHSSHDIRKITSAGTVTTLAGSQEGNADGIGTAAKFNKPWGMCFDEKNQSLLVCDYGNGLLRRVQLNGAVSTECAISGPTGVAITANGAILVASYWHYICQVKLTDKGSQANSLAGSGIEGKKDGKALECSFSSPISIAVHEPSHSCFIADYNSHTIRKISFTTSV